MHIAAEVDRKCVVLVALSISDHGAMKSFPITNKPDAKSGIGLKECGAPESGTETGARAASYRPNSIQRAPRQYPRPSCSCQT
jgi:hypothetical protein